MEQKITEPYGVIEALAPWPDSGDATEPAMARWFTVQSFASYCRLSNHPCWQVPRETDDAGAPTGAYRDALRGFARDAELAWTQYVAAYLLRERAGMPVDLPPAEALRREEDTGEYASETVADWLINSGVDLEQIVQAVREERGLGRG